MRKVNKINNLSKVNSEYTKYYIIILVFSVLVLIVLNKGMKKTYTRSLLEKCLVFIILFLIFLIISKNYLISFIGSIIIFLLINLLMNYKNTIENFQDNIEKFQDSIENFQDTILDEEQNIKSDLPDFSKNVFANPNVVAASENIQNLLKTVNGGIELKEDDLKESSPLNISLEKYSNDNKPNALKQAQIETYQLIDTVSALKDTITTLSPVLEEGKKLMSMFESFKI